MAVESNTVTGLFNDRDSAERAYQSASERGYDKSDVNLVMSDETRKKHFTSVGGRETELGNKAAEGAGIGGAVGGTSRCYRRRCRGCQHIAGNSRARSRYRRSDRGCAGGCQCRRRDGWTRRRADRLGYSEERVKHYEEGIKRGGILMGVRARSAEDARHLEQQWTNARGEHVYSGSQIPEQASHPL